MSMDWVSQKKTLLDADLGQFRFNPSSPCSIQTITLQRESSGTVVVAQERKHTSEQEYSRWIEDLPSCLHMPSAVLVMHKRLQDGDKRATSLPYGERTFGEAWKQLYQHRSIAQAIRRKSTATFTSRVVAPWKSKPEWGPAVVYNCKSDTQSVPKGEDDIVLSVTHFPRKQMIFAVFYGCTSEIMNDIGGWFKYAKASAFEPLFLPTLYADLERKRLVNKMDRIGDDLRMRIVDMENRVRIGGYRKSEQSGDTEKDSEKDSRSRSIAQRECEAVKLWISVSLLKNGLESLNIELTSMLETSKKPLEDQILGQDPQETVSYHADNILRGYSCDSIQARLHDMIVEIGNTVRQTNSLLTGMSLATQTESNYLTRRDASTTISIAVESKKDSSHMRYIAYLGMIFLPGTFFASLFSMGFFNWIPDESDQVVSPYIAIWMGVTIFCTALTWWRFDKFAEKAADDAIQIYEQLDTERDLVSFSGPSKHVAPDVV